jgi:uncharacterized membrane protein YcaP (DUF421 family)
VELYEHFHQLLGLNADAKDLTFLQISLRGIVVFLTSIVMLRVSDKRFLPKKTAFDAILAFILASMLARAVNGTAAFFPTLGGGFVLVLLHRLLAAIAFRWRAFGRLIKGTDEIMIKDGQIVHDALRQDNFTEEDLLEEIRLNGNVGLPEEIKEARMERSGEISVVKK